jgi:hypothetical protein
LAQCIIVDQTGRKPIALSQWRVNLEDVGSEGYRRRAGGGTGPYYRSDHGETAEGRKTEQC